MFTNDSPPLASNEPTSSINFRVERELRARVDRVAARSGLTVSQLSRLAVQKLVESVDDSGHDAIVIPLRGLTGLTSVTTDLSAATG